jgi:hypothetical protein
VIFETIFNFAMATLQIGFQSSLAAAFGDRVRNNSSVLGGFLFSVASHLFGSVVGFFRSMFTAPAYESAQAAA